MDWARRASSPHNSVGSGSHLLHCMKLTENVTTNYKYEIHQNVSAAGLWPGFHWGSGGAFYALLRPLREEIAPSPP